MHKLFTISLAAFAGALLAVLLLGIPLGARAGTGVPATDQRFCADANGDGRLDIADAVNILNYLFTGVSTPYCVAQAVSLDRFATREELDTLKARVAILEARSQAAGLVATGSYVGDGTQGRLIETGIPGKVRSVSLWGKNGSDSYFDATAKVETMPGNECRGTFGLTINGSRFIVDASYSLGDVAIPNPLNQPGTEYRWMALVTQQ